MRADFSRLTFDRPDDHKKHYAGVLHQQGRVWLDADWNEDVLTRLRQNQEENLDVIGPCGTPEDPGTAFEICPTDPISPNGDFGIKGGAGAKGHYYVHGVLAQLEAYTTFFQQTDLP